MDNEFKTEHQVTIGVEFGSFGLKINNQVIKLQIWDTVSIFCEIDQFELVGWPRVVQVGDKDLLPRSPLCVLDLRHNEGRNLCKSS